MDFQTLIETRRSIRHYDPEKKVTPEQVKEIIAAAQYAPSWKNLQTSRYYCVMSEEMLTRLRSECLPEFNARNSAGASALIVATFVKNCVGFDKETGKPINEIGNGWGCYDLGLQNENLVLKAKELGLGTLIMGIRDSEKIRTLLSVPENEEIVCVIALGCTDAEPDMPKRKALDDIVKFI